MLVILIQQCKECYDNNRGKHVYIDEDLCYFKKEILTSLHTGQYI